jgi:capsular polysaccharide export protein
LFLQGLASRLFADLGRAPVGRGHAGHRVNFNGDDRAFRRLAGAVDFRGRAEEWPSFLEARLDAVQIVDLIRFGDCRPLGRRLGVAAPRGTRPRRCSPKMLT